MCEQVAADIEDDALGRPHHRLRIAERGERTDHVNDRR